MSLDKALIGKPPSLCDRQVVGPRSQPVAVAQYEERLHFKHELIRKKKKTISLIAQLIKLVRWPSGEGNTFNKQKHSLTKSLLSHSGITGRIEGSNFTRITVLILCDGD